MQCCSVGTFNFPLLDFRGQVFGVQGGLQFFFSVCFLYHVCLCLQEAQAFHGGGGRSSPGFASPRALVPAVVWMAWRPKLDQVKSIKAM